VKAIVHRAIGVVALEEREEPRLLDPRDALVRVTTSGICGSDLHIVQGRDRGARLGTIMGHEFVGVIEEIGSQVRGLRPGDRVLAPFSTNCGQCFYCARGLTARCLESQAFGFVNQDGRGLEGAQAELVRVPLASSTLLPLPQRCRDGSLLRDEEVLFLGDIFSTAYTTAASAELRPAEVAAVIGCGPVGLLTIVAARMLGAGAVVAVEAVDYRRDMAQTLGAIAFADAGSARRALLELSSGRGADAALEAVGSPAALDLAIELVRPGGVVAIAGYHTEPTYAFPIHQAYGKNLTLKIGRCSARARMSELLPQVLDRRVSLTGVVSHVLPLEQGVRGYQLFSERREGAIKVLLRPGA
jgi:threonine dehydrogenase-like Zn-dependent dehydrogenase